MTEAGGQDPDRRLLFLRLLIVIVGVGALVAGVWLQLGGQNGASLGDTIRDLIEAARQSSSAPILATALLVLLNIAGVPLMLLTAGATAVFDDVLIGFAISWTSSMIGAVLAFWLGRWSGATLVRRFAGEKVQAVSERLGRRGILACLVIRLIPTAPAIVVNMVIGASHISFPKFLIGTGLGIAPKLAFIAVVTKGVIALETSQGPLIFAGLAFLILAWFGSLFVLRRFLKKAQPVRAGEQDSGSDSPPTLP